MTKEQKDGFSINDRRFWVDGAERPADESSSPGGAGPTPEPQQQAAGIDPEVLRSALAELEEAKRRIRRDADKQIDLMRAQVLEALLPVLDNLERSIGAAGMTRAGDPLLEGVKLVHGQFLAALAPFGLTRRSSLGERFDPRYHDAVAIIPVADAQKDGVVLSELEPAYVVGERVVRPAKVQVGRAADRPQS